MTKRMSAREARDNFSDLLGTVYYAKEPVIVERKGKPVAVIISPEQFERFEQLSRDRYAAIIEEIWKRNEDKDPEEVYRHVTEVVEEVRREHYEREHPAG